MHHQEHPERRATPRVPLTTFCPASFALSGSEYRALMLDLSSTGARIRLDEHLHNCDVVEGTALALEVRTPYGVTLCKGEVVWLQHIDEHLHFGIRFTSLPSSADDPLRALIDSTF